jgi:hypothetical protein
MAPADSTKRCAHAGCTCHVQGDAKYCSDSCARSANAAMRNKKEGCECGHAACVASEYAFARPEAMASNS